MKHSLGNWETSQRLDWLQIEISETVVQTYLLVYLESPQRFLTVSEFLLASVYMENSGSTKTRSREGVFEEVRSPILEQKNERTVSSPLIVNLNFVR